MSDEIRDFISKYFFYLNAKVSEITSSTIDVEFPSGVIERYTFDPVLYKDHEDIKGLFEGSRDFRELLTKALKRGVLGAVRLTPKGVSVESTICKVVSPTNYSFGERDYSIERAIYILRQNWHVTFRSNKDGILEETILTTYSDLSEYPLASLIEFNLESCVMENMDSKPLSKITSNKNIPSLGIEQVMPIIESNIARLEQQFQQRIDKEVEAAQKHHKQIVQEVNEEANEAISKVREISNKINTTQFRSQESINKLRELYRKRKSKHEQKKKKGLERINLSKSETKRQIRRAQTDYQVRAECELVNGCIIEVPVWKIVQHLDKENQKRVGYFHFDFIPSFEKIVEFPSCYLCQEINLDGYICDDGHYVCKKHYIGLKDSYQGYCSDCAEKKIPRCNFCREFIKEGINKCSSCEELYCSRHYRECSSSHILLCPFCLEKCQVDGFYHDKSLVDKCTDESCRSYFCISHLETQLCDKCQKLFCEVHSSICHIDRKKYCKETHLKICKACNMPTSIDYLRACEICGGDTCSDCWRLCNYDGCQMEGGKTHFLHSELDNQTLCKNHARICRLCHQVRNVDETILCLICNDTCCNSHKKICQGTNCNKFGCEDHFILTNRDGLLCPDCVEKCDRCQNFFLESKKVKCALHFRMLCPECVERDPLSAEAGCLEHFETCSIDGQRYLEKHIRMCSIGNHKVAQIYVGQCNILEPEHFICTIHLNTNKCQLCQQPCCEEHAKNCYICQKRACIKDDLRVCANCNNDTCSIHFNQCSICDGPTCRECWVECDNVNCRRKGCVKHFRYSKYEKTHLCNVHSYQCIECCNYYSLSNLIECSFCNEKCCKLDERVCANPECKRRGCKHHFTETQKDGLLCETCLRSCSACGQPFLKSKAVYCIKDKTILCPDCYFTDPISKEHANKKYFGQCLIDDKYYLKDHLVICNDPDCGKTVSITNAKVINPEFSYYCIKDYANCNGCGENRVKQNFLNCSNCRQSFCRGCIFKDPKDNVLCVNCHNLKKVGQDFVFNYPQMAKAAHLKKERGNWQFAEDKRNVLLIWQRVSLLGLIKSGKPEIFYFAKEPSQNEKLKDS